MEVLQRTANRGSISTGFDIDNSVKFEADNTEYMKFTSSQTGSDLYRMAFNIWLKRTELGAAQTFMLLGNGGSNSTRLDLSFDSSDRLQVRNVNSNYRLTTQVFRDTSAWYHLFFQIDTTQTTANDRIKVWVNGNLIAIGDYTTVSNPAQDAVLGFNRNYGNILGGREIEGSTSQMFSGYIAQVYGSGGTPPSVTDFGEFDEDSGIWKPKDISAISPPDSVNGFFLDFTDASDLGNDASGNGNHFTEVNITAADQATDTPTNNFATLNPLYLTTRYTITEGGTNQVSSANGWGVSVGSVGVTSGKWYFEVQSDDTNGYTLLGVIDEDSLLAAYINGDAHAGDAPYGITYYGGGGSIITNGSAVTGLSFPTWTTETMGCALDLDNNKIYFSKSGTYGNSGDPAAGSNGVSLPTGGSGTWFISTSTYFAASPAKTNQGGYTANSISSAASDENGYGTFEYAPPTGYYALCTKNLAEYG